MGVGNSRDECNAHILCIMQRVKITSLMAILFVFTSFLQLFFCHSCARRASFLFVSFFPSDLLMKKYPPKFHWNWS